MKRLGNIVLAVAICGLSRFGFGQVTITEIADTSTPVPGSGGTFASFGIVTTDRDDPELGEAKVNVFEFTATTSDGVSGIYGYASPQPNYAGGIGVDVDTTMAAPTGGYYSSFPDISEGFGEFGFIANTTTGTQLLMAGGNPNYSGIVVAQTGTTLSPGQTIGSFQNLSIMEAGINSFNGNQMRGSFTTDIGVYDYSDPSGTSNNGPLTYMLVANNSTIPANPSSPFASFGPVSYTAPRNSTVQGYRDTIHAVEATVAGIRGIYYSQSTAPLAKLVSAGMSTPDNSGTFTSFGDPVADWVNISFIADYTTPAGNQQGIFIYGPYGYYTDQTTLKEIVATGETVPGSAGAHFASFQTITDAYYFTATLNNGVEGLYNDGYTVIDTTDMLDGKSIANISISPEAYSDTGVAFTIDFTDGSEGLYYLSAFSRAGIFIAFSTANDVLSPSPE